MEALGLIKWYTRIDEHCVLGAIPLRHNYKSIVENENIKAVLTLNNDHELVKSLSQSEWASMGIDYKQIGINDFVGLPDLEQIKEGVEFINKHRDMNQTVYVHCKAGRYRSALFVACYLIRSKNMHPREAVQYIRSLRPHVILHRSKQVNLMENYHQYLKSLNK
jgi:atypical dual specificity phosphatase